jgi:hypothetical protein
LKHKLKERASMKELTIIGVDLAKNVFQLLGAAADGSVAFRRCQSASNRDPLSASNIDPLGAELARRCVVPM